MAKFRAPTPIRGIPQPNETPLLGSLAPFAKDPISYLQKIQAEHGDLVQFTLTNERILLVNDPALIETALVGSWRSLHKDAMYEFVRPLLGNGLVTSEMPEWKRNRKLVAPSFTPRHIETYRTTMQACCDAWVEKLADVQTMDLFEGMMSLTQQIVLRTLFGQLDVDVSDAGPSIAVVLDEFVHDAQGRRRVLPPWIPTPGRRRSQRAIASLNEVMTRILDARRAQGLGHDLLSQLMAASDDDGIGLSDQQLRDEAVTLFAAGHETTATALTYTLLLLARNPEEERRLVADPSRATLVLKEAMRLLPPVWAIGRETQEAITLGAHTIPKRTQLLVCMKLLHQDGRWFEDPTAFVPDRWLNDVDRPRFAYMPFGAGPRICVGNHFAMMEAEIALKTLITTLSFRPLSDVLPPMLASITLRPTGTIPTVVTKRR